MPHNNNQLVKRSEAYFLKFPCGYSSFCGSERESELKTKLHCKRCKSCRCKAPDWVDLDYPFEAQKCPLNAVVDKFKQMKTT